MNGKAFNGKILGFFVASAAILLTFGRCSPIAPSVYKDSLSHSETGGVPPLPSSQSANQQSGNLVSSGFTTTVANVDDVPPLADGKSRIVLSAEDETKGPFKDFREDGHALIKLDSQNPVNATGYFVVVLDRNEIASRALTRAFQVTFRNLSGNTYLLAISPQTPPDIAREVNSNLVSIVLEFDSQSN